MAEIVGLISAVGAIIGAAFKITQAINELCDGFEDAPHNIRSVADDTRILTTLLLSMQTRLERDRRMESESAKVFGEILSRCKADIDKIEASLRPLVDNKTSTEAMSPLQRLRWLFAKSKIYSHQAALASLKLNLMLFINTLHFCDGPAVEGLKENILNTIKQEKKDVKTAFLEAERYDRQVENAYDDGTEVQDGASPSGPLDGPTSAISLATPTAPVHDGSTILLGLQPRKPNQHGFDIHAIPDDDCLMWIAAHIALQRSVNDFSLAIIVRDPAPGPVNPAPDSSTPVSSSMLREETPDFATRTATATDAERNEGIASTKQPADSRAAYYEEGSDSSGASRVMIDIEAQHGAPGGYHGNMQHPEAPPPANVRPQRRRVMPEKPQMSSPRKQFGEPEYYQQPPPPATHYRGSYGIDPYARDPYARDPYARDPYARDPYARDPYARDPYARDPYARDPYAGDPYARDYFHGDHHGGSWPPPGGIPGHHHFNNTARFPGMAGPSASFVQQIPISSTYQQFSNQHKSPSPSPPSEPIRMDPEKEQMRMQLQAIKRAQEKREEDQAQKEREMKIRRDAEESFHRRMEEMRRAQEEAKAQIMSARIEAETAARDKLEGERIAHEQRRKEQEEERQRAEREAQRRLEAELQAERERIEAQRREEERRMTELEDSLRRAEREAREKLRDELSAKEEAKRREEEQKRMEIEEAIKKAEGKKKSSLGGLLFGRQ
ncbi:hypothetical protein B0T14DRAFT_499003 [Immersiella caudata]|uniref:Fungal N-terminal domain-containing protein n=1 Tax=Immersiella caudata TaxID=314043 RepID=A0AA39WDS5_9PEZI|nr:hypothetical protein B0T14DRAFT_499003 [Immersiella caudata]